MVFDVSVRRRLFEAQVCLPDDITLAGGLRLDECRKLLGCARQRFETALLDAFPGHCIEHLCPNVGTQVM